jgi:hypothetical protein
MWEVIWTIVVGFTLLSFTCMSGRIICKGLWELKDIFSSLKGIKENEVKNLHHNKA